MESSLSPLWIRPCVGGGGAGRRRPDYGPLGRSCVRFLPTTTTTTAMTLTVSDGLRGKTSRRLCNTQSRNQRTTALMINADTPGPTRIPRERWVGGARRGSPCVFAYAAYVAQPRPGWAFDIDAKRRGRNCVYREVGLIGRRGTFSPIK